MSIEDGEAKNMKQILLSYIKIELTEPADAKTPVQVFVVLGNNQVLKKESEPNSNGVFDLPCQILCGRNQTLVIRVNRKLLHTYGKIEMKGLRWKHFSEFSISLDAITGSSSKSKLYKSAGLNMTLFFTTITEDEETIKSCEEVKVDGISRYEMVRKGKEKTEKMVNLESLRVRLAKAETWTRAIRNIGDCVKDLHPALGLLNTALGRFIDACEKRQEAWEATGVFLDKLDELLTLTDRNAILKERKESRIALEKMFLLIDSITKYICDYSESTIEFMFAQTYQKEIERFRSEFDEAMKSFNLSVLLEVFKGTYNNEYEQKLKELLPCMRAHYRNDLEYMCLEGTRSRLLGGIIQWLREFKCTSEIPTDDAIVLYWIFGLAGSGKSTVANTIAAAIEDEGFYLSCFFCRSDDPELSDPKKLLVTLSYRIAQQHRTYRDALFKMLIDGSASASIATAGIDEQFEHLFKRILPNLKKPPRAHAIVVDALDECGNANDQKKIAARLLDISRLVPWIKVIVTSRPAEEVQRALLRPFTDCTISNINEEEATDEDIRHYVISKLRTLRIPPLSNKDISKLVKQAAGLFVWCSTLFLYLEGSGNIQRDLQDFLSGVETKAPLQQLYKLYDKIVRSIFDKDHQRDIVVLHAILGVICVSAGNDPLSVAAISKFMKSDPRFACEDEDSVTRVIRKLHAVLHEVDGAIRAHHPSFLDFVMERLRTGFTVNYQEVQRVMALGCSEVLAQELMFNICKLKDASRLNRDILNLPALIKANISDALRYGAQFWFIHLVQSGLKASDVEVQPMVRLLNTKKALHWLEVLSLLGTVSQGVVTLQECIGFFERGSDVSRSVADLIRFMHAYSEAFASTPHLYLSALAWLPDESELHHIVGNSFKHMGMIGRKLPHWENESWTKNIGKPIQSVAYSFDGRYIAAGLLGGAVRVWDARSGEAISVPEGHYEDVCCVAFSPVDCLLASASDDGSIRLWNVIADSGFRLLEGHRRTATFVSFSSDGKRLVSGSFDRTYQIWDVETGEKIGHSLQNHAEIRFVAFTADYEHIIFKDGFRDIKIHNVKSGHYDLLLGSPVTCSPNGKFVAFGSGGVRLWDIQARNIIGGSLGSSGIAEYITSLAFSSDSTLVASGFSDYSIHLWNISTGEQFRGPLLGHSGFVNSIAFSSNDQNIVSGSEEGTIRVWDVHTASPSNQASQANMGTVRCISISPNGRYICSASFDNSVCIWDAYTGETIHVFTQLYDESTQENTRSVYSVAVSSEGQQFVTGMDDATLHLWNADLEPSAVVRVFKGHTEPVGSIVFSYDGQRIVSGSWDKTIRIWDILEGGTINVLCGHSLFVDCVAIARNGQLVTSSSSDGTLRIWNAEKNEEIHVYHLLNRISSLSFSQDDCYVNGLWQRNNHLHKTKKWFVKTWSIETGKTANEEIRLDNSINSVSLSPDMQRIAAASRTTVCILDIRSLQISRPTRILLTDTYRSQWDTCCSQINVKDGWVKDGDKLLFWVPLQFRLAFKKCLHLVIDASRSNLKPKVVRPEVDVVMLFRFAGNRWADIYM